MLRLNQGLDNPLICTEYFYCGFRSNLATTNDVVYWGVFARVG